MRNRVWTGLLLAILWAGAATAQTPDDALAAARDCAAAEAALAAAQPPVSALRRMVAIICGRHTATTRRDPDDERALDEWHHARRHAIGLHVQELMASQDARSQLTAAFLQSMSDVEDDGRQPLTSTAAFAAARRLGGDDPLVAWMEAVHCPRDADTPGCDRAAALTRLQRLRPDNAATWTFAAARALERGDSAAANRYLARAAQQPHYDLPLNEVAELLYRALLEADGPPLNARTASAMGHALGWTRPATIKDVAALEAIAIAAAVAIPGFASLQRLCLDEVSASQQRRAACTGLLSLMAQADSVLTRSIGLGFMTRLTAGTPAGTQWRARQRALRWLRIRGYEAVQNGGSSDYLRSMWRAGEVAALKAVLTAAGQPLTPPPGWVSPGAALAPLR